MGQSMILFPDEPMNTLTPVVSAFALVAISLPMIVGTLDAQTTTAALTFEVASVRPSDANSHGMRFDLTPDNSLRATGVTLRFLLQKAYDVEDFQIAGGPNWARSERFDVHAKGDSKSNGDEGSPRSAQLMAERFRERLRVLLAERFQLSVRQEFKEGGIYILDETKTGHKLNKTTGTEGVGRNRGLITADNATMEMLAKTLSITLQRPVLDQTGLQGKYAFRLQWAEDGAPGEPEDLGVSLFTAIEEQLGLRLKSGKGPIKVVFIDRAEKPRSN
jgi:bla regulator protein blaR1